MFFAKLFSDAVVEGGKLGQQQHRCIFSSDPLNIAIQSGFDIDLTETEFTECSVCLGIFQVKSKLLTDRDLHLFDNGCTNNLLDCHAISTGIMLSLT